VLKDVQVQRGQAPQEQWQLVALQDGQLVARQQGRLMQE
jgi:hypothetical protein